MGLTTILSNRSTAIEGFYLRATYPSLIPSGSYTLIFIVPPEQYYELSLINFTGSGARITIGYSTATSQTMFEQIGSFTLNPFNTSSKIIMPAGSMMWIDGSVSSTITVSGTKFKVT